LRERNVELVINRLPEPALAEDFDADILYRDTIVVVAGANNPWTQRRKIKLADLVDEPWVLAKPDGPLWSHLIAAFRDEGLKPPRVAVTTNSYHARFSFLATGRFLSVRDHLALKFQDRRPLIKALPIELPMTQAPIAIITLKNRTLSPLARLFIENARTIARSVVDRVKRLV
jgi:DNA-binding transcriptional LysR family regulator